MKTTTLSVCVAATILCADPHATEDRPQRAQLIAGHGAHAGHDEHTLDVPIGVTGGHLHDAGSWMISYRYMRMEMEDNRVGTDDLSPETIATTVPNRFFGLPGQPPTLRVVPIKMTMEMHMLGVMYAPSNRVTLMGMMMYLDKEMDHVTFRGPRGSARLGEFTTRANGLGDTRLSALVRIYDDAVHHVHLNVGASLPTGSTDEGDTVLAPTGARPKLRLPYTMQLGSGTIDLMPGITYAGKMDRISWGGQYQGTFRLGENDEDYTFGDEHHITAWGQYLWRPSLSGSIRLAYLDVGNVEGRDPQIVAPVQTADPDNQGKERLDLLLGLNWLSRGGHRLALEAGVPLHQDLDGPQLKTDWTLTLGYQYAW